VKKSKTVSVDEKYWNKLKSKANLNENSLEDEFDIMISNYVQGGS